MAERRQRIPKVGQQFPNHWLMRAFTPELVLVKVGGDLANNQVPFTSGDGMWQAFFEARFRSSEASGDPLHRRMSLLGPPAAGRGPHGLAHGLARVPCLCHKFRLWGLFQGTG
jgi:hypothetical protein